MPAPPQVAVGFARENERMEMAGEMMDGALEGALDTEELEDETDDVMNQVRPWHGLGAAGAGSII